MVNDFYLCFGLKSMTNWVEGRKKNLNMCDVISGRPPYKFLCRCYAAHGLDDNSEEVSTRTRLEIATRLEEKIVAETPM